MLNRRQRIAAARLTGMTEAHTQLHRLVRDEALAGIAEVLAEFTPDVRMAILADTAASYVDGDRHHDQASAELLAAAGADLEQARQIRVERDARPNPLASVADPAGAAIEVVPVSEEERQAIRQRFRQKLAEMDAIWTPEKRAEDRRRLGID